MSNSAPYVGWGGAYAMFQSPSKGQSASISFNNWNPIAGNNFDGVYSNTMILPQFSETWRLDPLLCEPRGCRREQHQPGFGGTAAARISHPVRRWNSSVVDPHPVPRFDFAFLAGLGIRLLPPVAEWFRSVHALDLRRAGSRRFGRGCLRDSPGLYRPKILPARWPIMVTWPNAKAGGFCRTKASKARKPSAASFKIHFVAMDVAGELAADFAVGLVDDGLHRLCSP